MDYKANRKSKAPWQLNQGTRAKNQLGGQNQLGAQSQFGEQYDLSEASEQNTVPMAQNAANSKNRKHSRRLSIHASAVATPFSFDSNGLPPLPPSALGMHPTANDSSEMLLLRSHAVREKQEEDIVAIITNELRNKDSSAINEFHKSLVTQKKKVENDIKDKINQNQKNILQLTDNLQATQQELLLLRELTKELYGTITEITEAAERRLELELSEPDPAAQQSMTGSGGRGPLQKKRDRSSVLVLQKMWVAELQLLYKHVEGAQQVVQTVPGRHVLGESGRWHEINVGNWKPLNSVHLFLLNDMILVACRKQAKDKNTKALQLAHHWPLHMVELSQEKPPKMAESLGQKAYVISLLANSSRYYFQTDRADHYDKILRAYQKGKAEVQQAQLLIEEDRKHNSEAGINRFPSVSNLTGFTEEGLDKRQLRDSLRTSGFLDTPPLGSSEDLSFSRRSGSHRDSADMLLKDLSVRVHSRNRSHDFMKVERKIKDSKSPAALFMELKANEDKLDEVDVNIAHNDYTSAVGLIRHIEGKLGLIVERILNVSDTDNQVDELRLLVDVVRLKIKNRKMNIQQGLNFKLHGNISCIGTPEIANIIELYMSFDRLGEGIAALHSAWSSYLSHTVGRLVSTAHGSTRVDIVIYLTNLIIVHVLIVKKAVRVHKSCVEPLFSAQQCGTVDSSGFISWCISEMTQLAELVKKHASGTLLVQDKGVWKAKDSQYYQDLVKIMELQLGLLKEEGLNADYLFTDILHCSALIGAA